MTGQEVITIPYNFNPRTYQRELFSAMDSGYKRGICVLHRRAGKDVAMWNLMIKKSLERVGVYFYFFPEFSQGRRVIWEGITGNGLRFLDFIPPPLIQSKNATDMRITLVNGSVIQIMGTDKFDKVRGANPIGCVFSEFAFQNPKAWDLIRPILAENGGWALFNSSTNGKNHFYDMYQMAIKNSNWFALNLNVLETLDENGVRYISDEVIDAERASGMSDEVIQQEFYNSFTSNSKGFYYLQLIEDLEKDGNITKVPHDPTTPVDTYWDIGVGDYTCIWFAQTYGKTIHIIDYYEYNNAGMDHYAKVLQSKKYVYRSHNFPHDIANLEFGSGRTRYEVAEELFKGTKLNITSKLPISEGINAARMVLPFCRFDKVNTRVGLHGLTNYHKEFDQKHQVYKDSPAHDWASNPADAFRTLAIGITLPRSKAFRSDTSRNERKNKLKRNWQVS